MHFSKLICVKDEAVSNSNFNLKGFHHLIFLFVNISTSISDTVFYDSGKILQIPCYELHIVIYTLSGYILT